MCRALPGSALSVHKKFRELQPDLVPRTMTRDDAVHVRVSREVLERLPELRVRLRVKPPHCHFD